MVKKTILLIITLGTLLSVFYFKKYDTKNNNQADISFLIADFKWNKGILKILELGEGPQSFYQGFDELIEPGIIWQQFWHYLKQFDLPMWYVGNKPNTHKRITQFAFKDFYQHGGRWIKSLDDLEEDSFFKKIVIQKSANTLCTVKNHKGILIFSNHGYPNWYKKSLKKFIKKYPDFLVINRISTPYVNHKYKTSLLFTKNLTKYRPRWLRCKKKYTSDCADNILSQLQAPRVVIKPLNSANGWGNIMVEAADLDITLKKILINPKKLVDHEDKAWSYWPTDGHKHFLVEEFATSQPIMVDGKPFDGTMRGVFILKREHDRTEIHYIDFCWKLPKLSLADEGSIMQNHKSAYRSVLLKKYTKQNVKKVLDKLLPDLYGNMFTTHLT